MPIDNRDWYKGNRSWHRKRRVKDAVKAVTKAIAILLIIGLGVSTAVAYAGVEPFATYKDAVSSKIITTIAQHNITTEPTYPHNIKFRGTYRTTYLGIEAATLTFKDNTVIMGEFTGTAVSRYNATMQSETEGTMEFLDAPSGKSSLPFTYYKEADCIVFHYTADTLFGKQQSITYCK